MPEGLKARGVSLDLWDVVAMNGWLELSPYYTGWYDKQHQLSSLQGATPEHCSAFVAVGSYTRDGKVVIAHNNWSEYKEGSRWNIIFDIVPSEGNRILMDGMPGLIHSGDDFGVNSAGLAITETTIGHFTGFDPNEESRSLSARAKPCSTPPISTTSPASWKTATTEATPTPGWSPTRAIMKSRTWSWG